MNRVWWLVVPSWPIWAVWGGGCKSVQNLPDLKELLPVVQFANLKVDHVDFSKVDTTFVLDVTNPYPVGLSVAKTDWKLGLAGHPFLDGTDSDGVSIGASETSKVRIPVSVKFVDAFSVVTDAQGKDELPYTLDVDLGFDTPVGPASIPVHHAGALPALHAPKFSLKALRVERLDVLHQTASLAIDLGMTTEQGSALTFDAFGYDLKLAGSDVASGDVKVGPLSGADTVTIPVDVKLLGLGTAVVDALTKKAPLKVRLTGDLSVGTPFGAVPLSFDESADLTPR